MDSELDAAIAAYDELQDGERRATIQTVRSQLSQAREELEQAILDATEGLSTLAGVEEDLRQLEADLAQDITKARARVDQALWKAQE